MKIMPSLFNQRVQASGMTLIEVLVAMVILATALIAAMRTSTTATHNQNILQHRLLAEWVGRNRLITRRLEGLWRDDGEVKGEASMHGRDFIWTETIRYVPGANLNFRLITLTVADAKKPEAMLFKTIDFARKPYP